MTLLKTRVFVSLLVIAAVMGGCSVSFEYGARPLPVPAADSKERCFQQARLELGVGHAHADWHEDAGKEGNVQLVVHVVHDTEGLTFYQGGQRLELADVLQRIGDGELERAYGERLGQLESRRSYLKKWLWGTIGMWVAGIGVGLSSLALFPKSMPSDESLTPGIVTVSIGAVLFIAGLFAQGAVARRLREASYEADTYRTLFTDPNLAQRLSYALRTYNEKSAAQCGYSGQVTVEIPAFGTSQR